MDHYVCDFMKNKECSRTECVYFGGTCAATSHPEFAMSKENILGLSAHDFESMHYALPEELRAEMVTKGWYWLKHLESYRF